MLLKNEMFWDVTPCDACSITAFQRVFKVKQSNQPSNAAPLS
jgi:hypothetical protein